MDYTSGSLTRPGSGPCDTGSHPPPDTGHGCGEDDGRRGTEGIEPSYQELQKESDLLRGLLHERVKELRCVALMADITGRPGATEPQILREAVHALPPAFQYPDIACARIRCGEWTFVSEGFAESPWCLTTKLQTLEEELGTIEVFYRESRDEAFEGPFLQEELALMQSVALTLGRAVWGVRAREAVRRSERELRIRNRIATIFLTVPKDEMYAEVLAVVLDAMNSEFGVFGYLAQDGALVVPTMTRLVWHKCQVPDKTHVFPRESWGNSSWPRAIREKRLIVSNEPATNLPEGHLPIGRHASAPIIHQEQVVGLLQVANKPTDYDESDIDLLARICDAIAPVLAARLLAARQQEQRENAEARLNNALARTARSNRALEEFAYVASHDLQEPLRKIMAFGDRLSNEGTDALSERGRDSLERMLAATQRMQTLINDLLAYSRIASEDWHPGPVDLNVTVRGVLSDLASQIEEVHGQVEVGELPTVEADRTQMRRLLQNLISNGLKYHKEGQYPVVKVSGKVCAGKTRRTRKREAGDVCEVTIEDNGIGFDQKHAERIFVVFQRLHGRNEYAGTGVGLAICRKIVARHHGSIKASGSPGGATFVITLPLKQPGKESIHG